MTETRKVPDLDNLIRNGQSDAEILTRIGVPLVLGDRTWRVKPRTMRQDREWLAAVQEKITGLFGAFDSIDSVADVIASLGEATPDMLDLIFAYDTTGALDHEWIEERVMSREITAAFIRLAEEAYPPFAVGRRLMPEDQAATVIGRLISWAIDAVVKGSVLPEPTSSPSTSGATEAPKSLTTA